MGDRIGGGFFSAVYGCVDSANNQLAAKVFKPRSTYEEVKAAAVEEFQKLRLLSHPYITRVVDIFECRDTFYLITERCNCSLEKLFSPNPWIGPRLFLPVADCVLQAMEYIHAKGYVHQDAHMGNILASFVGRPAVFGGQGPIQFKLGDLGVAKFLTELDLSNMRAAWMWAPEVIDPQEFGAIDHRIDIFHVALMLVQLAGSRKLRFSAQQIVDGLPQEMARRLGPPYDAPLAKALRRHVSFRTASARELLQELHSY
jgi:serine/threonine protein kinase